MSGIRANRLSSDEAAVNYHLPVAAIHEAILYAEQNVRLLAQQAAFEWSRRPQPKGETGMAMRSVSFQNGQSWLFLTTHPVGPYTGETGQGWLGRIVNRDDDVILDQVTIITSIGSLAGALATGEIRRLEVLPPEARIHVPADTIRAAVAWPHPLPEYSPPASEPLAHSKKGE